MAFLGDQARQVRGRVGPGVGEIADHRDRVATRCRQGFRDQWRFFQKRGADGAEAADGVKPRGVAAVGAEPGPGGLSPSQLVLDELPWQGVTIS